MKRVIITGATGMIGNIILQHCLDSDEVSEVYSLLRRESGNRHEKLREIIIADFLDLSSAAIYFEKIDVAYFCIGVYTGAVRDDEFRKITVDYTIAFADMLKEKSPDAALCFLSGAGADQSGKSRMSFARYKGMAEKYLISKKYKQLNIFRPAYIYPVDKRKEPNFSYRIFRSLYPLVKLFGKSASIPSTDLGKAMYNAGISGCDKMILENEDIYSLI